MVVFVVANRVYCRSKFEQVCMLTALRMLRMKKIFSDSNISGDDTNSQSPDVGIDCVDFWGKSFWILPYESTPDQHPPSDDTRDRSTPSQPTLRPQQEDEPLSLDRKMLIHLPIGAGSKNKICTANKRWVCKGWMWPWIGLILAGWVCPEPQYFGTHWDKGVLFVAALVQPLPWVIGKVLQCPKVSEIDMSC